MAKGFVGRRVGDLVGRSTAMLAALIARFPMFSMPVEGIHRRPERDGSENPWKRYRVARRETEVHTHRYCYPRRKVEVEVTVLEAFRTGRDYPVNSARAMSRRLRQMQARA